MLLVIQVKDGKTVEHPIAIENIKLFNPNFDIDNLPEGLEKFERVDPPHKGRFQYYVAHPYKKVNGVWTDDWEVVDMPEEEKNAIIKQDQENFPFKDTWKWDDVTLTWQPPIPYPEDGSTYLWNDKETKWDPISQEELDKILAARPTP